MVHIAGEVTIDRPVDEVFDFVADARNEPLYNPLMLRAQKISEGPIGPGTRFRDETKSMGRPVEILIEITSFERPRQFTETIRLPSTDIEGTLTFDPVPSGTRMRWSWEVKPHGVLRLLSPLIARLGSRQERRTWAALKEYVETQARPVLST